MGDLTDAILISIFLSFPGTVFILLIGFDLSNMKVSFKSVIGISLIQTFIALIIHLLSIRFGIHTILQLLSLWFLVIIFYKMKPYKAIIPVLIGFFIDGIIQGTYFSLFNYINKVDFIKLGIEFKYTFILNLPIFLISILILIIIRIKRYSLCHICMENEEEYHV